MSALICDICGGKLLIGSGGVARCDSCGTEHTKERVREKALEIKGTVVVEGPVQIDSQNEQLQLARLYTEKGRFEEAEEIYYKYAVDIPWEVWWGLAKKPVDHVHDGVFAFAQAELDKLERGRSRAYLCGDTAFLLTCLSDFLEADLADSRPKVCAFLRENKSFYCSKYYHKALESANAAEKQLMDKETEADIQSKVECVMRVLSHYMQSIQRLRANPTILDGFYCSYGSDYPEFMFMVIEGVLFYCRTHFSYSAELYIQAATIEADGSLKTYNWISGNIELIKPLFRKESEYFFRPKKSGSDNNAKFDILTSGTTATKLDRIILDNTDTPIVLGANGEAFKMKHYVPYNVPSKKNLMPDLFTKNKCKLLPN